MTVYVDLPRVWHNTHDTSKGWRYGPSAHLMPEFPTDKESLEELHTMAKHLGLKREWFQRGRWPHYDLTATKQKLAVRAGAVVIETRDYIKMIKERT